eukprot:3958834-Prorocentrum_lima.AAC.1
MTSSLVGSEMCIRDSNLKRLGMGSQEETRKVQGSTQEADDQTSGTISPVSYTHLTLPTICSV